MIKFIFRLKILHVLYVFGKYFSHAYEDIIFFCLSAECPVCGDMILHRKINSHLDACLNRTEKKSSLRMYVKKSMSMYVHNYKELV